MPPSLISLSVAPSSYLPAAKPGRTVATTPTAAALANSLRLVIPLIYFVPPWLRLLSESFHLRAPHSGSFAGIFQHPDEKISRPKRAEKRHNRAWLAQLPAALRAKKTAAGSFRRPLVWT